MPNTSNLNSGGVQNRETKNRTLGMIVTSFQYSKLCKKQISQTFSYCELINSLRNGAIDYSALLIRKCWRNLFFCEAWSPEMTSQSFPVSCFWSRSFVPHWKWNLTLLVHWNMGKENHYRKIFCHTYHLIKQIKKSVTYTLSYSSIVL